MGVRSLRSSFALSLAFHTGLVLACALFTLRQSHHRPEKEPIWIEVEALPKKTPSQAVQKNQIVQTTRGHEAVTPASRSFLGEKTQTVDRETVSRTRTTVIGSSAPKKGKAAKKLAQSDPKPFADKGPLANFGLPILPHQRKTGAQEATSPENERNWAEHGTSPHDYVKGIQESDRTALNTKEYVFYGYFQRIRSRLDRAWVPILREKLVKLWKSGRRLASDQDHSTRVLVIMNRQGEIVRVEVMGESGVQDLDDAAVRAFNQAGPFPNPPQGIVDENHEIRIPWEFILKS